MKYIFKLGSLLIWLGYKTDSKLVWRCGHKCKEIYRTHKISQVMKNKI